MCELSLREFVKAIRNLLEIEVNCYLLKVFILMILLAVLALNMVALKSFDCAFEADVVPAFEDLREFEL